MKPALLLPCTCLLLAAATASAARPIRVVVDTDIGTDFDDTWAVLLLLSRPDVFDVKLIQCSTYNTTIRALITAKLLSTLGRFDVPIGVGQVTPGESSYPQYSIASNYSLAEYEDAGGAVSFGTGLLAELMASSTPLDPVVIVEIAPATSLGAVLAANPALANACLCVAMSGSVHKGYNGGGSIDAEYNVVRDIPASQLVYNASWLLPLVTAPLDTTIYAQFEGDLYQSFRAANDTHHVYASALMAHYEAWYNGGGKNAGALLPFSPSTGSSTLYDAQAAYMAGVYGGWRSESAEPPPFAYLSVEALPLAVNGTGFTVPTPGAKTVYAATGFPEGMGADINSMGLDIIASIVAQT